MAADLLPFEISLDQFQDTLQHYDSIVPDKLAKLELERLHSLPQILQKRTERHDSYLEKKEVEMLVEWKLKHGTFRPKLLQLVSSNTAKDITATTSSAFSSYKTNPSDPVKALNILTKLRGIGPATASLILSTYDPDHVAFFSDELFRWLHMESRKQGGWDRKIAYNMKEYRSLCEKLVAVKERLHKEYGQKIAAIDIEKVAYILGKQAKGATVKAESPITEQSQASLRKDSKPSTKPGPTKMVEHVSAVPERTKRQRTRTSIQGEGQEEASDEAEALSLKRRRKAAS